MGGFGAELMRLGIDKRQTLDGMAAEFRRPFRDPRPPATRLGDAELFFLLISETPQSLMRGSLVTGRATAVLRSRVFVMLDCQVEGQVDHSQLSDERVEDCADFVQVGQVRQTNPCRTCRLLTRRLQILQARVLEIRHGEFQVIVSVVSFRIVSKKKTPHQHNRRQLTTSSHNLKANGPLVQDRIEWLRSRVRRVANGTPAHRTFLVARRPGRTSRRRRGVQSARRRGASGGARHRSASRQTCARCSVKGARLTRLWHRRRRGGRIAGAVQSTDCPSAVQMRLLGARREGSVCFDLPSKLCC